MKEDVCDECRKVYPKAAMQYEGICSDYCNDKMVKRIEAKYEQVETSDKK